MRVQNYSKKTVELICLWAISAFISLYIFQSQTHAKTVLDIVGYRTVNIQGELVRLGMEEDIQSVAIAFVDPQCDSGRGAFLQSIKQAQQVAKDKGIAFYSVIYNHNLNHKKIKQFVNSAGLGGTVLFDATGELAHRVSLKGTPEAFIVDASDNQLYRGHMQGLADALGGNANSSLGNNSLECHVSGDLAALPSDLTYNKHMKELVNANCLKCHSKGGVAPFSLTNYQESKVWAGMMAHVTKSGFMPPWRGLSAPGHRFRNERRLSDRQIAMFQAWLDQGVKEGVSENKTGNPKVNNSGWRLGEPDVVLTMEEPYEVPAVGEDIYRYFVMKDAIPKDMVLVAIDFKPGDPGVVHHCNFFLDYERRARKMDAKDPKPGFEVMGNGFMDYFGSKGGQFPMGAWAPGGEPVKLPKDMGISIPAGGDFVIEIHYHLNGKKTQDQSTVGLYLAKKKPEKEVTGLFVGTTDVKVPANDDDYWRHFYMDVNQDMDLVDIAAHMHYIGKEVKILASLPSGETKPLLLIKNWDLRWQNVYVYREPVFIPKGSRINAYMSFDNSKENPANPFSPPVPMKWGWGSDEEMAEIYLTVYPHPGWMGAEYAGSKLINSSLKSWYRGANVKRKIFLLMRFLGFSMSSLKVLIRLSWFSLVVGCLGIPMAQASLPAEQDSLPNFNMGEVLQGKKGLDLEDLSLPEGQAVALVFLGQECPISRRFIPKLNELAAQSRAMNIHFMGVFSDHWATLASSKDFRDSYEIKFPLLLDEGQSLAKTLQPIAKPEAFVINEDGVQVYRGRIDDRFIAIGRLKKVFNQHDLQNAMVAVKENKIPEVTHTKAVGCFYGDWESD